MTRIAQSNDLEVIGGVDTHKDVHVAAVMDVHGRLLATAEFPNTRHGYRRLLAWLSSHGPVVAVGVEGCGSWGAGVARYLTARTVRVVEVNRPNRQARRMRGKSDPLDAEEAARAVLAGRARVTPKAAEGPIEALRQLKVARSGAVKARTAAANQIHSLIDTAPDAVRAQLRGLSLRKKVAVIERWRPTVVTTPEGAARRALASVSRRWRALDVEVSELRGHIQALLDEVAPEMLARHGVGYETAGQLLITAGDNPERLHSEAGFAALCGSSPVPASSGKMSNRHRLNRGGDRQANSALWHIARVRMRSHQPTKDYVERRTAEGMPKIEIMRCLKRYIARELYPLVLAAASPEAKPTTASEAA